jgi:transcriptional regulator with XRE-family HTH domain
MDIKQIAGDNIRFIREKRAWVQEDLAIVAKLSKTYIGEIERGEKAMTIVTLQKIAKAFKVTPALLLTPNAYRTVD